MVTCEGGMYLNLGEFLQMSSCLIKQLCTQCLTQLHLTLLYKLQVVEEEKEQQCQLQRRKEDNTSCWSRGRKKTAPPAPPEGRCEGDGKAVQGHLFQPAAQSPSSHDAATLRKEN